MHLDIAGALLKVLLLWILTAPHEFAHAWVATRLGDDTPPERAGSPSIRWRMSTGSGPRCCRSSCRCSAAAFSGGASRSGPSRRSCRGGLNGLAIVSLAGPFSNVIMAVIMGGIAIATLQSFPALREFMAEGVQLSLYLAIFNMLPIPPLDGSKLLLAARVPVRVYIELARFGFMLLIVLISLDRTSGAG